MTRITFLTNKDKTVIDNSISKISKTVEELQTTAAKCNLPDVTEEDNGKILVVENGQWTTKMPADSVEADNTLPITSSAVYTTVGNINSLLETI